MVRYPYYFIAALLLTNVMCNSSEDVPKDGGMKANTQAAATVHEFVSLFNGKNLDGWQGAVEAYTVKDGALYCKEGAHGNLFTTQQFSDFILRFEYKVPYCGNNGVGIRTTMEGAPSVHGMEIQILDNALANHRELDPVQMNGSIYGVVPAKTGHAKPPGKWNEMEILADGSHIRVTLNGTVIVDADLSRFKDVHYHGHDLDSLHKEKGYIALCGHKDPVGFRNIRIKRLP